MKKIHIKRFSTGSMILAGFLSALFIVLMVCASRYYNRMETATELYIISEKSALKLQKGSDTLTEQVRLYVMTGESKYMDAYFEEAEVTKNREGAVAELREHFAGTQILSELENALGDSQMLMDREYYAMRLAADAFGTPKDKLPEKVAAIQLTKEDQALDTAHKLETARSMVSGNVYERSKPKFPTT